MGGCYPLLPFPTRKCSSFPASASLPCRQQSCLRDHTGTLTISLFFRPGDFSTVPALQPASASNCTNSGAHKMKGMVQGLGTKRQAAGWAQGTLKAAGASMPPEVPPQPERVGKRKKKKRRQGSRSSWRQPPPFLHLR